MAQTFIEQIILGENKDTIDLGVPPAMVVIVIADATRNRRVAKIAGQNAEAVR